MTRAALRALARLLAPWRTIRRLEATVQRLEHVLANPMVAGIEIGKEKALTVGMRGSGPALLAGMFLGLMEEKGRDAPNYLELFFNSPRGRILVTVTQPNGATPHELRSQAEQRVRQLESELRRLQRDLEAGDIREGQAMRRCPGWGDGPDDWLEECHDCQRRTVAGGDLMPPPAIVALWCENYEPLDRPEDQRLRELALEIQGDPEAGA